MTMVKRLLSNANVFFSTLEFASDHIILSEGNYSSSDPTKLYLISTRRTPYLSFPQPYSATHVLTLSLIHSGSFVSGHRCLVSRITTQGPSVV